MNQFEDLNDQSLIAAALADRNAFAGIVRAFEPVLRRYVRRLLGPSAQAVEDVLQEVFIKAYVNLNDYDDSRPFAPWIYRIAHNESVSHLRKRGTQPQVIDGEAGLLILERLSDGHGSSDNLDMLQNDAELHRALGQIDSRYRDVLVLRYLEDKSYDDISDILEMPPGTVATRIQRGLKKMRAAFAAAGKHNHHD